MAAFWAADSLPFRFNGYFLKPAMLFAYKLVNRHDEIPGANILKRFPETHPLDVYSARWLDFLRSQLKNVFRPSRLFGGMGAGFQILETPLVDG